MAVGAEEQARPLAPQVEPDVRIADEGKAPRVLFQRRNGTGDEVLVLERRHRNVLPGKARDLGTVDSGRGALQATMGLPISRSSASSRATTGNAVPTCRTASQSLRATS